jgi:peptidoglycan/LPS O-acetylase OafA/YrhL
MQVVFFHFVGLHLRELPRWLRYALIWTKNGHFAVDVFIVISGYCLMLPVVSSTRRTIQFNTIQFFKRRARRILPPYYVALFASLIGLSLLPPHVRPESWSLNFTSANIMSHLFLVHNLNPAWHSSINMALWSVATECQVYFFFPLLLLPVWRRYGNPMLLAVAFAAGLAPHYLLPQSMRIDCGMPWYIGLFSFGMVGAAINASGVQWSDRNTSLIPWIALLLLSLYGTLKYLQPSFSSSLGSLQWFKDTTMGALALGLIVTCAHFAAQDWRARKPVVLRVLESRCLVSLGTVSYSLYLMHCVVLEMVNAPVRAYHLSGAASLLLRSGVGIPAAVLVSYGMYWAVESRFVRSAQQAGMKQVARAVPQRS